MKKSKQPKEQTPLNPEAPREADTHANRRGWIIAFQILAGIAACVLLLWGLAGRYLWQDEANTAVLATRLLKSGRPLSYDGVNFVSIDDFSVEDPASIGERTADPRAAVDYYIRRGYLRSDSTWTYQPLGQFLVAAVSLKLLGQTTLAARLPFALAALATLLVLYRFVLYRLLRVCFDRTAIAALATALLLGNAYWILHGRLRRRLNRDRLLIQWNFNRQDARLPLSIEPLQPVRKLAPTSLDRDSYCDLTRPPVTSVSAQVRAARTGGTKAADPAMKAGRRSPWTSMWTVRD